MKKRNKMFKKLTSIVLSIIMMLSMLTVGMVNVSAATDVDTVNANLNKTLYFDNSQTKWASVYLIIGHDGTTGQGNSYSAAYELDLVSNTSNKYKVDRTEWTNQIWNGFTKFFFADNPCGVLGGVGKSIDSVSRTGNYTDYEISQPSGDMFQPDASDKETPISGEWVDNSTYKDAYYHNASASPAEGGTAEVTGDGSSIDENGTLIPAANSVTYTATPNTGYIFDGWYQKDSDVFVSANNPYTIEAATSNTSLVAKFTQSYKYTVSTPDSSMGSVRVSDTVNTSGTSIISADGREVTYTATPTDETYEFIGWSEEVGGTIISTDAVYKVPAEIQGLSLVANFEDLSTPEFATIFVYSPTNWGQQINKVVVLDSKNETPTSQSERYTGTKIGTYNGGNVYEINLPYEYVGVKYVGLQNDSITNIYGSSELLVDGALYRAYNPAVNTTTTVTVLSVESFVANSVDGDPVTDNKNVTAQLGSTLNVTTTVNRYTSDIDSTAPVSVDYYIGKTLIKSSGNVASNNKVTTDLVLSPLAEGGASYDFVSGETYTIRAVVKDEFRQFESEETISVTITDPVFTMSSHTKSKDFGSSALEVNVEGRNLNLGGYKYTHGDGVLSPMQNFNSTTNATIELPNVQDETIVIYFYGSDHTTPLYTEVYSVGNAAPDIAYVRPETVEDESIVQDVTIYVLDGDSNVAVNTIQYTREGETTQQDLVVDNILLNTIEGEGNAQAVEYLFKPSDLGITQTEEITVTYETTKTRDILLYGPISHDLPTSLTYTGGTTVENGKRLELSAEIAKNGTRNMHYYFLIDYSNTPNDISEFDAIIGDVITENAYEASVVFTAPIIDERELEVTIKVYAYSTDPLSPTTGKGSEGQPLYTEQKITITREDVNKIYLDASNHDSLKACVTKNDNGEDVVYLEIEGGRTIEMVNDPTDPNAADKKVFVAYLTDEELDKTMTFSNGKTGTERKYYEPNKDSKNATTEYYGYPQDGYIFSKDNKGGAGDSENWGSYNTGDTETITEAELTELLKADVEQHYNVEDMPADLKNDPNLTTNLLENPEDYEAYIRDGKSKLTYIFYDNSVTKWHEVWLYSWSGFNTGVEDKDRDGNIEIIEMKKVIMEDGRDIRYYKLPEGSLQSWNTSNSEGFLFMDRETLFVGLHYMQSTDLGKFTYQIADDNGGNNQDITVDIKGDIFDSESNVIYPVFRADGFRNATEKGEGTLKQRAFIEVVSDLYNTDYEMANVTFNIIPHDTTGVDTIQLYTDSTLEPSLYSFPNSFVEAKPRNVNSDVYVVSLNIPYTVDENTEKVTVEATFGISINGTTYGADTLEAIISNGTKLNEKAIETGEVWFDLPTRIDGYSTVSGVTENVIDIIGYEHSTTQFSSTMGGSLVKDDTYAQIGYTDTFNDKLNIGSYSSNSQTIEMAYQNPEYITELSQDGVVGKIAVRDITLNSNVTQTSSERLMYQLNGWYEGRSLKQNPYDDNGNEVTKIVYQAASTTPVEVGAFFGPRKGDETYTTYFILTDDMQADLTDGWLPENLRWTATNISGTEEIIDGGIPVEYNPHLYAFGKPYDIDGTIYKITYHSNIKTIRFYDEKTGKTAEGVTKTSTPELSVQNGVRDEKVYYIQDYSKYDSSTEVAVINEEAPIFGWYDLTYDVNFTYPEENTRFYQEGETFDLTQVTEETSSTQSAHLFVSANYKNISPNVESIYNEYVWGYSEKSQLTADHINDSPVIPNDVNIKPYTVEVSADTDAGSSTYLSDDSIYIKSVSAIPLETEADKETIKYYKYNENYSSDVNPAYLNNGKKINVEYDYVLQLYADTKIDLGNGKEATFVGWYDVDKNEYISYYYKHTFVVTQDTNIQAIYSDSPKAQEAKGAAVIEDPLYETSLDGKTAKIKMTFPLKFLVPAGATNVELNSRYIKSETPIEEETLTNDDARWSENRNITTYVNAQNRVNYNFTENLYKEDGSIQDINIYMQTSITYTDKNEIEHTEYSNIAEASPELYILGG